MNTEIIADQIRTKIVEGSKMLGNLPLRMDIVDTLASNHCLDENLRVQMSAEVLMTDLAKNLINLWPARPASGFPIIEDRVKYLQEITAILNSEELNKWVHVRANCCVMMESRMALDEFKKNLWKRLFGD